MEENGDNLGADDIENGLGEETMLKQDSESNDDDGGPSAKEVGQDRTSIEAGFISPPNPTAV